MKEGSHSPETPETVMANLVSIAGGDEMLPAARVFVAEGLNVEAEAKWLASKGILGDAVALISVSKLVPLVQITLAREFALQATRLIEAKKKRDKSLMESLSYRNKATYARAGIVIKISTEYLNARQVKA
jgi:hypothetical protein